MNRTECSLNLRRHRDALGRLAVAFATLAFVALPATAQVTYQYAGNPFTLFSCGGNSDCSTPGPNANTSYTASDVVNGTLTLNSALPPNLSSQDVSGLPGFQISLNDGHQTMTARSGYTGGFNAKVSTDSFGNITGWVFVVNCCFYPNNGIATANDPSGGVFDQAVLSAASYSYPNTPYNLGLNFNSPGTWSPATGGGPSGTAARTIMTGSAFGLPDTPQDLITGADGKTNTTSWNFIIPSGWSYARGTIIANGLQAGAYSSTSGPCSAQSGTCGVGAGRGIAYRSWSNTSNSSLSFQVNAVLEGEFQNSSGTANAGIYVFDATAFANAISGSGLQTPEFLLNGSTLPALAGGAGLSLANLVPSSAVLLNDFRTLTGPANQLLNVPIATTFVTVGPQESITLVFDVSAYAPGFSTVNFASTLAPSPTLPLFTDASGNAVSQLIALGPSTPPSATPASLTLTPATASIPAGTSGTVTATVTDSNGNPVPNAIVFFAFNSGPNIGPAGPISTDANGHAVFTYTDNGGAGTDVIQATLGTLTATPVSITWTAPGPLDHIVLSPATATINPGASQIYSAAAFDRFNNSIGDVTSQTVFSIALDGSCTAASCSASVPGSHTVTGSYSGKTAQATLLVNALQTPVMTWASPAAIVFGTALGATQLNATANVPGTFVYTPPSGMVLGAGTQLLSVVFTPTNTASYTTAAASVNLLVNKATPVINWATPAPITAGTPLSGTQLNATANVAGSFVYAPTAGTVLSAGNQTLSANFTPADSTDYTTATAQVTLAVNSGGKTTPVINWATPAPISYGIPLNSIQLNASANVAGTFAYHPSAGTILAGGTQTLSVTFTPTNTTAYNSATASVMLQVNKATPPVLWLPLPIIYGIPLGPLQLDALTYVPGKFTYTPAAGSILPAGQQKLSATFLPNDTTDYVSVTVHATLLVLPATPVITWPTPAPITVSTPLGATQLDARANVPGTFVYSPSAGTKLPAGTDDLVVTFTPTDRANYQVAKAEVDITVKSK